MKLMAAVAIACGIVGAPMMTAPSASGSPGFCDGAGCVPSIDRTAVAGEYCVQNTRYNLGLDAAGNTLACSSRSMWIAAPALVGIRTSGLPCGDDTGLAQTPDGITLSCTGGAWRPDYSWPFYR